MRPGSRPSPALTVTAFGIALGLCAGRAATASPPVMDLLAARGSRLADDLRRELGTSGFLVVVVESTTADWRADVQRLAGHPPIHGVVVRADDRLMTVFTRTASTPNAIEAHLEQTVEPRDRLARRRACLSVVEYLRVLSENDPSASFDLGASSDAPTPEAPSAARTTAPLDPSEASRPGRPSRNAVSTLPGSSASLLAPRTTVPAGHAVASSAPTAEVVSADTKAVAPTAPVRSAVSPSVSRRTNTQGAADAAAGEEVFGDSAAAVVPPARYHGWEVGVGSTLDLEAAPGGPTVHLQFLWYLPLEWRLAICVRALWPVLGGQFRTGGNDVRVWTFGGAGSLQYLFKTGSARLRPFVGTAMGTRVALTETTAVDALQSRETFTPSVTLGAEAGVRYGFSPLVQLFLEVGVVHGWLVPGVHREPHEDQAANSDSLHASFGVLFEI